MHMGKTFHLKREEDNTKKTRELIKELPPFVGEYFLGIQNRTTALTRLNYAYDLRIFFDYLAKMVFTSKSVMEITLLDIDLLTQTDLETFLEYLSSYTFMDKTQSCTILGKERKLSSLRTFYKYFFNKDKLTKNTAAKVASPKHRDKEIVRLEPDEVARLISNAATSEGLSERQKIFAEYTNVRDTALLVLLLGTGIRISECVGLDLNDLDFSQNAFVVTRKGGARSILYFSQEVEGELRNYLAERENMIERIALRGGTLNQKLFNELKKQTALFISYKNGARLSARAIQMLVKKYAETVTTLKNITPHKLRSTFGTSLYRETGDIYVVADVLGHKDVNTTKKHYAAINEDKRRSAASAVKLKSDTD